MSGFGPPPLQSIGLVLHHDGRFTHEGQPIANRRLLAVFARGVRFLPGEGKYVVQVGPFRAQLDVEEAGFFVRSVDLASGRVALSDGARDRLDPASLRASALDADALLCTVKRSVFGHGLAARFTRAAQAELLLGVEERDGGFALRVADVWQILPDL